MGGPEAEGKGQPDLSSGEQVNDMHGFPFWTVETSRRHGIRRRRRDLLAPQTYPEAVGQWLADYRDRTSDMGFAEIRVLEYPLPGISPMLMDPHELIQTLRDTTLRVEAEHDDAFNGRYRER